MASVGERVYGGRGGEKTERTREPQKYFTAGSQVRPVLAGGRGCPQAVVVRLATRLRQW